MDYKDALRRVEEFRDLLEKYRNVCDYKPQASEVKVHNDKRRMLYEEVAQKYGEVADIVDLVEGRQKITVSGIHGAIALYSNYIEAGYLSSSTHYRSAGWSQLLKVIGKVRRRVEDPTLPTDQASVTSVVRVLQRFRECCQHVSEIPQKETDVQDIAGVMLRSHFDRVDREETLPRFGAKQYRPDFGIPDAGVLVEVKFVGPTTQPGAIQDEILSDVQAYLTSGQGKYAGIIVLVYDRAQKFLDPRKFIEDLGQVDGIVAVLVVPGIG